jgi:hypothetical protein
MIRKEQTELIAEIDKAKQEVKIGGSYIHYKHSDQFYTVLRVGFIEETEKVCVIYEAHYGEKLVWVRSLEDFLAKVKLEDGSEVDRFTKVE